MATPAKLIPDLTTGRPPRRRRRLPVSLRIFVAMLVLLCTASALWIGPKIYRQQAAIREIRNAIGTPTFEPGAPPWLSARVPESWLQPFETLAGVELPFSETLDA